VQVVDAKQAEGERGAEQRRLEVDVRGRVRVGVRVRLRVRVRVRRRLEVDGGDDGRVARARAVIIAVAAEQAVGGAVRAVQLGGREQLGQPLH